MYYYDKFEIGDIIRSKLDKTFVGHIKEILHKSDIDTNGRYNETYYWTEYYFDDDFMFTSYDDYQYELLSKEIGPNQIKEYDKILINKGEGLEGHRYWMCDLAAGWTNESSYYDKKLMTISQQCVNEICYNILPYNNETKKLIGTNSNIPIYYHYPKLINELLNNMREHPDNWNAINDNIKLNIKYN